MTAHFAELVDHEAAGRPEPLGHMVVQEFLYDVLDLFSTLASMRIGRPDVLKFRAKQLRSLRDVSGNRLFSSHNSDNNYSSQSHFRENVERPYVFSR